MPNSSAIFPSQGNLLIGQILINANQVDIGCDEPLPELNCNSVEVLISCCSLKASSQGCLIVLKTVWRVWQF
jgi:hypothetical protein